MTAFYKFMATGFGSGYSPFAPGTAGSIVACLMYYLAFIAFPNSFNFVNSDWTLLVFIFIFLAIGVLASQHLAPEWGEDPPKIVIDEIVGMWITMLFIPAGFLYLLLGLALFRLFDIFKPLGIRKLESLGSGWGVMMDDVMAGVYANIVLQVFLHFFTAQLI